MLTSIALPKAWADQRLGPRTDAKRQLNPDVLSAAIERRSLPPYFATGSMRRIGNRASYSRRETTVTAPATSRCTTIAPRCARPSKPTNDTCSVRSRSGPTGQPTCQEAPSSAAVTALDEA